MNQPPIYPSDFPLWLDKRDNRDLVEAAHVNRIQTELDATQRALGRAITVSPDAGTAWYPQGGSGPENGQRFMAYTGTSGEYKWPTLNDRIRNVERAALRNLDFNYVSTFGGARVSPAHNISRDPNTGGIAVELPETDTQPGFAVVNPGQNWDNGSVTLWANGDIKGAILKLKSRTTQNTAVLDPDTGFTIGRVSIGPDKIDVGTNIAFRTDVNSPDHVILRMDTPVNENADTIFLRANSGGIRNFIRVKDPAGHVVFSVDSDGNTVVNTLKILKDVKDNDNLYLNGVHLHRRGLYFTGTHFGPGEGGSYRPDGLGFGAGGGLDPNQLVFAGGQRLYGSGPNIVVAGPLTHLEGGLLALGMQSVFYRVAGSMFIPIPQRPGGPEGNYEPPRRSKSKTNFRDLRLGFDGPVTGRVKITWSAEIRAYSRPVYVSFGIQDMATGQMVLQPSDDHACMNNGARSASEQTDVDHVTAASVMVVGGLTPGRPYHLVVFTRAADTGAGDVGKDWTQADRARFLIEPMMTAYAEAWANG